MNRINLNKIQKVITLLDDIRENLNEIDVYVDNIIRLCEQKDDPLLDTIHLNAELIRDCLSDLDED